MLGIPLGRKDAKVVAVADIGSASAGVALLALARGAPAVPLAAERALLSGEERVKDATAAGVAQKLHEAGEHVLASYSATKNRAPIASLYVIIRAPWTRSKTAQASAHYETETPVSAASVEELAKRALESEQELDKKDLLEAAVVRVELNGYPTGEPKGKRAHDMTVHALVSTCDADMRAKATAALEQLFPHLVPTLRSSTRAAVSVLGELAASGKEYVIADVGSAGTHLIAVRDGVAQEHELVPEGVNTMLKRIAPLGMPEETLNLLRMLARDECSESACEAIAAATAKAEPELVRSYGEAMAKMAAGRRLPERFVLIAHPSLTGWLAKFFSRIDFTQFTITAQPFAVQPLSPADLSALVAPGAVPLDIGLSLSSALVSMEHSRS